MEKAKAAETTTPFDPGPPWKSGVLVVKHEMPKDNAMVVGGAYGVIIGLLAGLFLLKAFGRG